MKASTSTSSQQRKRKRAPVSKIERTLGLVVDKFVAAQNHAEERYLQLEEKRMKLIMEAEEHRMERADKQQEEDRQHELQIWAMMTQALGGAMHIGGLPRYPYQPYSPSVPGHLQYSTPPGNPPYSSAQGNAPYSLAPEDPPHIHTGNPPHIHSQNPPHMYTRDEQNID